MLDHGSALKQDQNPGPSNNLARAKADCRGGEYSCEEHRGGGALGDMLAVCREKRSFWDL